MLARHRLMRNPYFHFHPLHTLFALLAAMIVFASDGVDAGHTRAMTKHSFRKQLPPHFAQRVRRSP